MFAPLALGVIAGVLAIATPAAPTRWIEDRAAFLSPSTRAALDARLESYQHATGHQIVVWIGPSLEGAPLDDWATRTFAAWKLGRSSADDGLAMFVFATDRAIAIEVGYGLEDKVPDLVASRIIRDVMAPRIRAGDRDGGITHGVDAILAAIEGRPWTGHAVVAAPPISWTYYVFGGLGALALLFLIIKHPRAALWMLMTGFGGRSSGGGGGGVFGGGGGRSGGGGARGGW